jgi:hypothetical protein
MFKFPFISKKSSKVKTVLMYLGAAWTVFVALYFMKDAGYMTSPDSTISFTYFLLYFSGVMIGLFMISSLLTYLADTIPKISKFKPNAFHFLLLFFFTCSLLSSIFLIDNHRLYTGPTIIETEEGAQIYEGGTIDYNSISLKEGVIMRFYEEENYSENLWPYFESVPAYIAIPRLLLHFFIEFGLLLLLMLILYIPGSYVIHSWKDPPELVQMSLRVGVGALMLALILFAFAKLSLLTPLHLAILITGILAAGIPKYKTLFKTLWSKRSPELGEWSTLQHLIGGALILMLSWHFIEATDPIPSGFDDYSVYLNLPNILAQTGTFLDFTLTYPISLIQSLGPIFVPDQAVEKTLILGFGMLGMIPIYHLAKKIDTKGNLPLLLLLLHFTIPTIFLHSTSQLKFGLVNIFYGTLVVLAIYYWMKSKENKWLILTGLLTGFVFSIKLTGAFLVVSVFSGLALYLYGPLILAVFAGFALLIFTQIEIPFVLIETPASLQSVPAKIIFIILAILPLSTLAYKELKNRKKAVKKILVTSILGFCILLPILPWWGTNLLANQDLSLNSLLTNFQTPEIVMPVAEYDEISEYEIDTTKCSTSGGADADYDYYTRGSTSGILGFLLTPWDITMNSSHKSLFINISFLFLAFCPLAILGTRKKKDPDKKIWLTLTFTGILFWAIWSILGEGAIWYGFSGWIFLLLPLASGIKAMRDHSEITKYIMASILVIFLLSGFFLRTSNIITRSGVFTTSAIGLATESQVLESVFPEIPRMAEIVNEDPDSTIYVSENVYFKYLVENNYERVHMDHFIDAYSCIYSQTGSSEEFINYLKASGIDYMMIRHGSPDPNFPALLMALSETLLFYSSENLEILAGNDTYFLFKIE